MPLLAFCSDVLLLVLSAVGVVLSFANDGWGMFRYYTLDSNLFLLLACAVQAWYELRILRGRGMFVPSWARVLKYCAVCAVALTFFTVLFILTPARGGWPMLPYMLAAGSHLYHHLLCPVLGILLFLFADRASLPDRRVARWALLPTLAYGLIALSLNAARVLDGPYFFLRVHERPPLMSVVWLCVVLGLAWVLALGLWRLSLRFAAPREAPPAVPEAEAWTADGYLKNQDALGALTYRAIPASFNACGPVAVYNLLRREGRDVPLPDLLAELDGLHLLRVPGPTWMYAMRRCLTQRLPGWREVHGRDEAVAAASRSRMGIFRYREQGVPHFVAYVRAEGEAFRFFNICDGAEDTRLTMADFAAGHLLGGRVRLLYWE